MNYFDLHSDTLYEAYHKAADPFGDTNLMAPLCVPNHPNIRRVLAIWSDNTLDDNEAYNHFWKILSHYKTHAAIQSTPPKNHVLAVEDIRIVGKDLSRLEVLYDSGVRVITLTWKGLSSIGGAWDTNDGLTPFGKEVVRQAVALGMKIDLSHASDQTFHQVIDMAKRLSFSPIASHSNSRALCPHRRNLTDGMFRALQSLGGLVGISFVPNHLSETGIADIDTVLSHILHFLSLGGENCLAIGSDFDGVATLPHGIKGIASLSLLEKKLASATSAEIAEKILYRNACRAFGIQE